MTDSARYWTMVDVVNKFTDEGQVKSFEVYSKVAGRGLRIGIYDPLLQHPVMSNWFNRQNSVDFLLATIRFVCIFLEDIM